eukprot:407533-Rhodomonas_salina.5
MSARPINRVIIKGSGVYAPATVTVSGTGSSDTVSRRAVPASSDPRNDHERYIPAHAASLPPIMHCAVCFLCPSVCVVCLARSCACNHATMQPCNHATMQPCNHAAWRPCTNRTHTCHSRPIWSPTHLGGRTSRCWTRSGARAHARTPTSTTTVYDSAAPRAARRSPTFSDSRLKPAGT